MIKANELRATNLVYRQGVIDEVRSIDKFKSYDYLEPIPLTLEMLEKCGLKHYCNDIEIKGEIIGVIWPVIENPKEDWEPEYQLGTYVYSGLGDPESYGFKVNVQYLHQLQNLFFALTGEELEVNL
jgi:hypothetical protein